MALPNAYIKDFGQCRGPIFVPGEEYQFYLNFDNPVDDPSFNNLRLDLYDGFNVLKQANVGILTKDVIADGFYNIIINVTLPEGVVDGTYHLVIWDTVANVIKAKSNVIIVVNEFFQNCTAYVAYRHKYDLNGIRYESNPNYYNKVRLPLIEIDYQFQGERKQYRNVTDRELRSIKNYKDEVVRIESYYFDRDLHRATSEMYDHDTIFINNIKVTPTGAYTRDNIQSSMLSKGSIEAILDDSYPVPEAILVDITYRIITRDGFYWDSDRGYYLHE